MKYQLKGENIYGNWRIAEFMDLNILLKFVKDNPMTHPDKNRYIIVVEHKSYERFDVHELLKHVKNRPGMYNSLVLKVCTELTEATR